jgi:opacity protein-like surface antigen
VRCSSLLLLLVTVFATPARADWHVTPFLGATFGTNTNAQGPQSLALGFVDLERATDEAKFTYGGAVTLLGPGVFGLEGEFCMTPGFFEGNDTHQLILSSRVWTVMGNLVVAAPLRWTHYSLRPYATGGVGLIRATAHDQIDVVPIDRSLFGYNAGGGVIGFFDDKRGLRLDLRYVRNIRTDGQGSLGASTVAISYWRGTAGLILKF